MLKYNFGIVIPPVSAPLYLAVVIELVFRVLKRAFDPRVETTTRVDAFRLLTLILQELIKKEDILDTYKVLMFADIAARV